MRRKKVIICVTNDLTTDQRVHKVANTLMHKAAFEIELIGRKLKQSAAVNRNYKTKHFHLVINSGPLFYLFFNLRLFFYLLFSKFDVLLSNDLDTLPACKTIAQIRKKRLVYDSHELFTEVPELVSRPKIQKIWLGIERFFIKGIDAYYTVCDPIANIYNEKYGIHMSVIRNVPNIQTSVPPIKNDIPTLIYQGALNMGRGVDLMIQTMLYLIDFQLIICGAGDLKTSLEAETQKLKLKNVSFLGHLDFNKLKQTTNLAHIGLSWEENIGANYYNALPNKLFDYIQARIPVLISDLPAMRQIVEQYKVGEVLKSKNPEKIALQIRSLFMNRHTFAPALEFAAHDLCWENEEQKLLNIFK